MIFLAQVGTFLNLNKTNNTVKIFLDALSRVPTVSVGTQALILGSMYIIVRRFPDVEFVMLSAAPEVEHFYLDDSPFRVRLVHRSLSQFGTIQQIRQILNEVDAVVSAWGDGYSTFPPHLIFRKTFILKRRRIPLILFTASIGPFEKGLRGTMARWGLSAFDRLTVRDMNTYRYISALGLKGVKAFPDTAFALPPSSDAQIDQVFMSECIPQDRPLIGVNVSILLQQKMSNDTADSISYNKLMLLLVKHLQQITDATIILIPHQFYPEKYALTDEAMRSGRDGDDRVAVEMVRKNLENKRNVYTVKGEYTPSEYKGLISRCQMFIGGRMHSVIASLSTCVPSVIMGYSHKAGGVMEMLGLSDHVWDINNSPSELMGKVTSVWQCRQDIRNKLLANIPQVNEEAFKTGDVLAEVLSTKKTRL